MNLVAQESLVARARRFDKHALGTLVSLFEDRRAAAVAQRGQVLAELARMERRAAPIIGVTGTPGSGKSSLLSRVVAHLLAAHADLTIAVLAVDPSSAVSGGALLGDRTRMQLDRVQPRLFFRSQASANELGGLSPTAFQVCGLLARLCDCVLVETVGIGQSEADIRKLADRTFLVLQPLGGDEIQFLKAGIMEVPDAFILNKCDEPAAERSYYQLRASLGLARPDGETLPVFRTSARTGLGVDALADAVLAAVAAGPTRSLELREAALLERWVQAEWGRRGMQLLSNLEGGAADLLRQGSGIDGAQRTFSRALRAHLMQAEAGG